VRKEGPNSMPNLLIKENCRWKDPENLSPVLETEN